MEDLEKENKKESDDKSKIKKEKIIQWIKNPYNLTLAIILISIIALRFYYFWMTKNQPVWWDESEYLSAAKSYAGIVNYQLHEVRLPGFPILISLFYLIGITQESLIRFFIGFIPSIIVLFVFYFLIKEMYPDKKIALISTIILGVLWENLFYSNRFQTENLSIIFEFLALLIFFKVYIKKEKLGFFSQRLSLFYVLLFSIISFLIRPGNMIFFPSLILFFIFINQSFITSGKNKKISYALISLLVILAVFFLFNLKSLPVIGPNYHPDWPLGWVSLKIFNGYYESVIPNIPPIFLYAFLIGLVLVLFNTFTILDRIKNIYRDNNYMDFKSDFFNLLLLFSVFFAFIFIIRPPSIEFRWFFMILPPILVFTSKGIISFSEFIGNFIKNKKIAIFIIFLILSLGVYNQIIHADSIIKNKLNSYSQVRDAGLWIRQNSEPKDIIFSASVPQNTFYSERQTIPIANLTTGGTINEEEFIDMLKTKKPKYLVISIFEPSVPKWSFDFPAKYNNVLSPVQAYFGDADNKQPLLIIYEFKNYDFS